MKNTINHQPPTINPAVRMVLRVSLLSRAWRTARGYWNEAGDELHRQQVYRALNRLAQLDILDQRTHGGVTEWRVKESVCELLTALGFKTVGG